MHLIHTIPVKCTLCEDCGWVCANHPHKPWASTPATAGVLLRPCPWRNPSDAGHPPRMPDGFDQKGRLISDRGWSRKFDDPIALPGCSWRDVLDLQAVGEFDKAHFQVLGFRDAMGGFHHAFQPLSIGGDQRHVFTGH